VKHFTLSAIAASLIFALAAQGAFAQEKDTPEQAKVRAAVQKFLDDSAKQADSQKDKDLSGIPGLTKETQDNFKLLGPLCKSVKIGRITIVDGKASVELSWTTTTMLKLDVPKDKGAAVTPDNESADSLGGLLLVSAIGFNEKLWMALLSVRLAARKKDCVYNMKQLGVTISMYEDRFRKYPEGTGADFIKELRKGVPDVAQDGLFVCKAAGSKSPGPGVCDYRGPKKPVSDVLAANAIIMCDEPDNHGDDINVLFFDGHVETAVKDSELYERALTETIGKPIPKPGMGTSPEANEISAAGTLKNLVTCEATWRQNDTDRNESNDYWTGDVSGFYRVLDGAGNPVNVMDIATAKADAAPVAADGDGTAPDIGPMVAPKPVPKFGYFFQAMKCDENDMSYQTDGADLDANAWENTGDFGFCAFPAEYGKTGKLTFIVNGDGVIWQKDTGGQVVLTWPANDPSTENWMKVE
jgi:prepilin-type processing-associated H-X9-DG protein